MLAPPVLDGRDRYERRLEAWTDAVPDDALTHTALLRDPGAAVELAVVARPGPAYEIRQARCRVVEGPVAGSVAAGVARLAGVRMVAGFTRRVAEAAGPGPGAGLVVDAAIEVARLARQVTRLPRERVERSIGDPGRCWELDTTGWPDLPDSCFTYSAAGRALFGARPVAAAMTADLYSPRPGQRRVFVRDRRLRVERREGRILLFHAMYDNVHGFEVTYEIDAASGRILRAEHLTPRLPYQGICSEPQRRMAGMVGEVADQGLRRRAGTLLGGPAGCAQLYDLTADLLKLLG